MANIFPGATWRPMPKQELRPKRRKGRGVGYHIAVSEAASIYGINLGTGNDAHLYVRRDGTAEQNIDLDLVAYAGAAGNATMIWVETQGGTTPADVRSGKWTPQQAETLAQIAAYAHRTEGTPLDLMPDSRPTSRGLATHRLGIQHSRGIGAVPGFLIAGGERWSSAVGKECPGDARVAQMPAISARAEQIASGAAPIQEDDMTPEQAAKLDRIHFELTNRFPSRVPGSKVTETLVGYALNTDAAAYQSLQLDRAQAAAITALTKLVAEQNGLTIEDVQRVVEAAIAKGLSVDVTVASGNNTAA